MAKDLIDIFVVCQDIRAEENGLHSLMGVFGTDILLKTDGQNFEVAGPIIMDRLAIFISLARDLRPGKRKIRLQITHPDGSKKSVGEITANVSQGSTVNIVSKLDKMPAPQGEYTLSVETGKRKSSRIFRIVYDQSLIDHMPR